MTLSILTMEIKNSKQVIDFITNSEKYVFNGSHIVSTRHSITININFSEKILDLGDYFNNEIHISKRLKSADPFMRNLRALLRYIKFKYPNELLYIDLSNCNLTTKGINHLLNRTLIDTAHTEEPSNALDLILSNVISINFSHNPNILTYTSIHKLIIKPSQMILKYINFSNNNMNSSALNVLLHDVSLLNLEVLNLSDNPHLNGKSRFDHFKGIRTLIKSLKGNKVLNELNLINTLRVDWELNHLYGDLKCANITHTYNLYVKDGENTYNNVIESEKTCPNAPVAAPVAAPTPAPAVSLSAAAIAAANQDTAAALAKFIADRDARDAQDAQEALKAREAREAARLLAPGSTSPDPASTSPDPASTSAPDPASTSAPDPASPSNNTFTNYNEEGFNNNITNENILKYIYIVFLIISIIFVIYNLLC
jgi:hypothetical protein